MAGAGTPKVEGLSSIRDLFTAYHGEDYSPDPVREGEVEVYITSWCKTKRTFFAHVPGSFSYRFLRVEELI